MEIAPGLHHLTAPHPDWRPAERDSVYDWPREVGWVVCELDQVVLIDPLVDDWEQLDALVGGRTVTVLVTMAWHERSAKDVIARYDAATDLPAGVEAIRVEAADEIAFWIPRFSALVPGDCLVNRPHDGGLRLPPPSWKRDRARLRDELRALLARLPVERVLVSHGEPVLSGARAALDAALA